MPFVHKTDTGRVTIEEAKRLILRAISLGPAIRVSRRPDDTLQSERIEHPHLQALPIDEDFSKVCQDLNIEPRWEGRPAQKGYTFDVSRDYPQDDHYTITHDEFVRLAVQFDLTVTSIAVAPVVVRAGPVAEHHSLDAGSTDLAIEMLGASSTMPHFVTSAWPRIVPAELLALDAATRITHEENIAGVGGNTTCSAGEYREAIAAQIARQGEGFFTVNEAAQVLADSYSGMTGADWKKNFHDAHAAGVLAIRHCASRIPFYPARPTRPAGIPPGWTAKHELVRDGCDLVMATDVETWRAEDGGAFPPAAVTRFIEQAQQCEAKPTAGQSPVPPAAPIEAVQRFVAQERAVLAYLGQCEVNPRALPARDAGKPGIKAKARKALQDTSLFVGETKFDKAWERLRASGQIQGGR